MGTFFNSQLGIGLSMVAFTFILTLVTAGNALRTNANSQAMSGSRMNNKVSFWACINGDTAFYFVFVLAANIISAALIPLIAPAGVQRELFQPLEGILRALVFSFLGIVAYQGIIAHITFSTTGKELWINERISRLLDKAVEETLDRQTEKDDEHHQEMAADLGESLSEKELNTHIINHFNNGRVTELNQRALAEDGNAALLKAQYLAAQKPADCDAILKQKKKRAKKKPET